ncbi:MAG: transglycosylase SLT domain-containing protein [Candidatus Binatia bacterium]|nr:transglycosylase SLT domain-containing protein [Candidatus Binatia bacterium]
MVWFTLEWATLSAAAAAAAVWAFGQAFSFFWSVQRPGFRLLASLATAFVSAVAIVAGWALARAPLHHLHRAAPLAVAAALATSAWWLAPQHASTRAYVELERNLATRAESERERIAHQVYAAYRRAKLDELATVLRRAAPYLPAIEEASVRFRLPSELLVGIAATESSFLPRKSADGGHGLFQITAVPAPVERVVKRITGANKLDWDNPHHNALLAAATLRYYWQQQNGDLFLALLAYNIGPANGGLRDIMQRYGATDFLTIQPYLQSLPADYPIRVLAAALAYRVLRRYGELLRYEEGDHARQIQSLGIPGLDA